MRLQTIIASMTAAVLAITMLGAAQAQAVSATGLLTGTVTSAVEGGNAGQGYVYVWNSAGVNVVNTPFTAGIAFQMTVPVGSYRLEITSSNGPGVNALSPYYLDGTTLANSRAITIVSGATTALGPVPVPQGGTVSGTISHDERNLLAVSLYDEAGTEVRYLEQSNGAFAFTGLPPGVYRVRGAVRYYSDVARPEYWRDAYTLQDATPVTVTGVEAVTGIDIALDSYAGISGTVTYVDGSGALVPLQDVTVRVIERGVTEVRTKSDGTYRIVVPPGTYHLRFSGGPWSPPFATQYYGGTATMAESTTVSIGMEEVTGLNATMLPGASISGQAVSPGDSNPPYVFAQMVDPVTRESIAAGGGALANGSYLIEGLPAGTYALSFVDSNDQPWKADEFWDDALTIEDATLIELGVGEAVTGYDAELDHPRPQSISGFVTNTDGEFVGGVTVATEGASTVSRPDGSYHLSPLSQGWHTISFTPPSGSGYLPRAWADPYTGDTRIYLDLHEDGFAGFAPVYRPGIIHGTVSGIRPSDAETLTAVVQKLDAVSQVWIDVDEADADAGGAWALTELPPGQYRVLLHYRGPEGTASRRSPTLTLEEAGNHEWSPQLRPWKRDLNGDLWQDILYRDSLGHLKLYAGNGSGGFAGRTQLGSNWGGFTAVVSVGDFDGDDVADIVARASTGYLYLYRGVLGGGFTRTTLAASSFWKSQTVIVSPGDFDGDGFTDLVSRDSSGYLWLHSGSGTGLIAPRVKIGSTGWKAFTSVLPVGDLNEDGAPDLAARDASGVLWLYPGNGTGGFTPRVKLSSGWGGMTAIRGIGDFNGDWHPDVIARDANGYLWLFKGTGAGLSGKVKIGSGWKSSRLAS